MNEEQKPKRRGRPPREDLELRVVGIHVKPAPDADDRLRRIFTILARLVEDGPATNGPDPSTDDGGDQG